MKLGKAIKEYTDSHGISAREFARATGLSHTHIVDIMKGKPIEPNIATLKGIAGAMGITLLDLLMRSGYVEEKDVERYITKQQLEKILPPEYHYLLAENKLEYLKLAKKMEAENIAPEYLMELLEIVTKYDKK